MKKSLINGMISREWFENGPRMDRVKSRISPMRPLLTMLALLMVCLFGVNENAWGKKNTDGTITIISGKGTVSIGAYYKTNAWTTKTGASGSISTIDNENNIGVAKNVAYNDRGDTQDGWLTFTATAATGYTFYGWCTNTDCSDASPDKTKSKQYDEDRSWGLHHDLTVVRYTKFVPITYKIAFDKNGGTHGSTAGINSVTYDKDVTLTKNGFYKAKYVVTYDINGGTCATTVDTAYYPFDGWATTAGGKKAYNDNATLTKPNFKSTQDETQTLFAKWGSGTTSVKLPTPTAAPAYDGDGSYSFAGWYDGDTKVGVGEGAYTPTKNVTLKAKWTLTKEPGFAGAVAGTSQSLKVGGTFNFVFSNTSTTSPSASSSDYFYYVIETTTAPTGNRNGSSHPNDVISFSGTTVTALNNGVATIKFYQNADASNNIAAGESDTYTFTVTKNDPAFTWTPQTYYYNSTYEDIFSSSNHDTQLTCSTTNSGAAEMVNGTNNYQKTLKTYNGASATITIEQAENYKWNYKKVDTYAVTNNKANNHVAFTIDNDNYSTFQTTDKTTNATWSNPGFSLCDGGWDTQDDYVVIKFTGIPDKLNFDKQLGKSVNQLPGTYLCQVYQSADGTSWGDAAVWTHNQRVENTNGNEVQLSPSTRYIKFAYQGTVHCYYKNINVTELQYFRRKGANTTLDFATNVKDHVPAVQSFVVEHANAGYQTSVTAPEHYLVSKDNVNFASEVVYSTNETAVTGGDKMGTFTVYVKYLADAIGTHNANVTVHNNLRSDFNVPVTGTTKDKIATQIEYCGASSYSVDAANIASTTLFRVRDTDNDTIVTGVGISLSCEENEQFSIAGGNALDPECGGTNNVKPSFASNDTYAAATNNNANFAITITRRADEINFDNARSTLVVGDEIDLSDWASAESESEIIYEVMSSDQLTGTIKIENGKLIALSAGTVRIKATSEGNCLYNSGYDFHNMKVRNPGDPCGSLLLDKSATVKCGVTANTSESPQEYTISAGPMDELKFKIWRVATAGDQVTIRFVDKDGNAVPNGTYTYSAGSLGTSKPDNYTVIDVSNITGATKLQIYGGGLLNKYVSNVQITQKAYLTTYVGSTQLEPTANVTMPEVKACNTSTKDITIKYSDLTPIQLSHTNDVFTYEIYKGENKVGFFDNDCRGFGTYTVRCICTPTSKGEYSDVLTLTASGQSQTINLSLNATAPEREIVWDIPTGNTISATQSVDLTAYAKTDCENPAGSVTYSYTSAVEGAATIEGSTITFNKAATVTVKASTVASDVYEDATPVEKVWTVGKVGTQMRTLPTITSTITYGENSSVVTYDNNSWVAEEVLNNNEVKGHINYVGPASFTAVGPQNLIFNFTPDSIATYDVCQFTVPVTVQPKASVATPVAANITYGQRVNESVLSCGAGSTTAGSWAWKDEEANTQVLDARENVYTGLNVIFTPESNNYAPIETTVSLKVDKADPEVTPQASDIIYGQTISESDLTTASGDVDGTWSWAVDDTQVLNAGEHNLTANFTSNDANYNNLSNVAVTLTVNKAASVATPTAADITAGQKVSESALTNSGTAGSWAWDEAVANTTPAVGTYNYTVHFTPENDNYTTLTTTVSLKVNALVNEFTNAAGDGDWSNDSNWSSGSKPDGTENPDVIVSGQLVIDEDVTVGNLTIEPEGGVTVVTNGTLTINGSSNDQSGYGDLYVKNGGEVEVVGSLKVGDLVVEASIGTSIGNAQSGQVAQAEHIVYKNAYIDINMDPNEVMDDTKWYGFTVPFAVDAHNGVSRLEGSTIRQCVYGSDYLIAEYDAIKRLNSGNGWKFISGNTLNAGQFYFLTVDGSYNTYRFKASGSTYAPADDASLSINGDVTNYNANWNGVGNSTLQHVTASYAGGEYVQVYMNGKDAYKTVSTNDATFVVGCPFFVQAKEATTLSLSEQNSTAEKYYAPRRIQDKATGVARISLSAAEGGYSDQIYFSAVDKEQDAYIIGQDLAKAGESTVVPQLWMAQYNQKLSVHEAALNRDRAACSLGIYTPKAGLYEIAIDAAPEDATLYLTYNGRAIWNLSMSAYEFDLEQGTTEGYGLRIVASEQTTTDIENAGLLNDENGVRKVMIDDVIYIVTPEGKMYDIVGKGVKF